MRLEEDQHNLARWAQDCIRKGIIHQIVDPHLKTQILPNCLKMFVEVAMKCLHDHSKDRPTMDDVVGSLELALATQESLSSCTVEGISSGGADICQIVGAIHVDGADLLVENPGFEQDHTFLSTGPTNLTNTKLVQSMTLTAKGKDSQRNKKKDDRGELSWWLRNPFRRNTKKPKEKSFAALQDPWRHFSLSEVRAATNNFDEDLVIGGPNYFKKLYKGYTADGILVFAVRKFIPHSPLEDYSHLLHWNILSSDLLTHNLNIDVLPLTAYQLPALLPFLPSR
ncbi:hypothetical protein Vadar_029852 [Vaccinium darrowii]|uniref:Uncharacterized protein n=1 Tax=Vaccinium darrowii TaxID=229202 RepID=A0ACB7Y383_9ERIC|nr:hypothetical protein Vadar_029852 [Vaccinium darrowii]